MTQEHSFGSGELTPELVRGATFDEVDGRVDATQVRTFLDRVASALDVFLSGEPQQALRLEFARNAEIAQQVLDAGQAAADQLRRQAGEDARRILDETRTATDALRADVERDLAGSRTQVVDMRERLMQDLRDLHDRIGASLYRFERAIEESPIETGASVPPPATGPAPSPAPEPEPELSPEPAPPSAAAPANDPDDTPPPVDLDTEPDLPPLPEGAKAPAWTQLPPDAWTEPGVSDAPAATEPIGLEPLPDEPHGDDSHLDQFLVIEDEPLQPGEPLVDLRDLGAEAVEPVPAHPAAAGPPPGETPEEQALREANDDARAEALLAGTAGMEGDVPSTNPAAPADGGSWLEQPAPQASTPPPAGPTFSPLEPPAAAPAPQQPAPQGQYAPQAPQGAPPAAAPAQASPDAMQVRQLILEAMASGQPRAIIEQYLQEQLGFVEPGSLVDAALASRGT